MNLKYKIYHDTGQPLVFVGRSFHNTTLLQFFQDRRPCIHVSFEELNLMSDQWFQCHQFICCMSNIGFKTKVVEFLHDKNAHFFSVVSDNSIIGHNVHLGKGVMINHFNVIYDHNIIHDHACVTNHVTLSHKVKVGAYSHLSPYVYMCFTDIGCGNYIGLRSNFFGYPDKEIKTPALCNFQAESRVTRSVNKAGTWYGNRMVDTRTSVELDL